MPFDPLDYRDFLDNARAYNYAAIDIEHKVIPFHHPRFPSCMVGVSFCTGDHKPFFIREWEEYQGLLGELWKLSNEHGVQIVGHNIKYDLKCLKMAGVIEDYPEVIVDTMVCMNLVDENLKPFELGLKVLVSRFFKYTMVEFNNVIKTFGYDSPKFEEYAKDDTLWTCKLWEWAYPKLVNRGCEKLFRKILMESIKTFADMELHGFHWDRERGKELKHEYQAFKTAIENDIYKLIGRKINLNSGDQLCDLLFTELKIPTNGVALTKSGKRFSTDEDALNIIAPRHKVAAMIKTFRTVDKLLSTYVEPMNDYALESVDKRVHSDYWLVSATGRTRSQNPNAQNVPTLHDGKFAFVKHLSIRDGVRATPGHKLIVADLSQIELRLCGHISGDREFLKAYRTWTCNKCNSKGEHNIILHSCPKCGEPEFEGSAKKGIPATFWHGLDLHRMTADGVAALAGDRQMGKTANFALIYAASAMRLNFEFPEFSVRQWEAVREGFFDKYIGVYEWHVRMEHKLKCGEAASDLFGRKRLIPPADIKKSYKHALNQIINFPVQASACNLIQLAIGKLRKKLYKYWDNEVRPILFVHDELDLEVREDVLPDVLPIVQETLELGPEFSVPIRAGMTVCDKWSEGK